MLSKWRPSVIGGTESLTLATVILKFPTEEIHFTIY